MIAVVDYGAGNLFSVKNACDFLGLKTVTTRCAEVIEDADGIILPGVGAFPDAMKMLGQAGLISVLRRQAKEKPLFGICLGMQMLFDYSTEFERTEGLGLIPGYVDLLDCDGRKLPHIGWNELEIRRQSPILADTRPGDYVYFVHSYGAVCDERYQIATVDYGCSVAALVGNGSVFGAQFHPEKSGAVGLSMLKNFGRLVGA